MAHITSPTIITGADVERAVIETLQDRLPYYLAQHKIPAPRTWRRVSQFDIWPENQTPAILVNSPGMPEAPRRQGDGSFIATWQVGVAFLTHAATEENSRDTMQVGAALIRACLLQQASLGGFARGVDWTDESYDIIPLDKRRSLAVAEVVFGVEVANVVNARELPFMSGGPAPTPSDNTVTSTVVVVTNVSPNEEVTP